MNKVFFTRSLHGIEIKVLFENVFDRVLPYSLEGSRKLPNSVSVPIEEYCYAIGKIISLWELQNFEGKTEFAQTVLEIMEKYAQDFRYKN